MPSAMFVRPSVSTLSFNPPDLDFYLYMGRDHSSPGIGSQGHRSQSEVNANCKNASDKLVFTAASCVLTDGRSNRFPL